MSDSMGSRFSKKLRGLKYLFIPPDVSRRHARRLKSELARARQAFDGSDRIVLTHTYGKVGSTAIHKAVSRLPGFGSFQTHFISASGVADALRLHREEHDPIHMLQGDALRQEMEAQPERPIRVITLVRDPVARAVSDIFENPEMLGTDRDFRDWSLEKWIALAEKQIRGSLTYTEQWFDRELSVLLGFDFFSRDFDRAGGFEIYREGRFELLAGKLERLSTDGAGYLGRFLDLGREFPIPQSRARSATSEAALYAEVKRGLKLPAELLGEVYSSRVCMHFYTPGELEEFRKRWIQS
ncbi:MAG: putative capsular polysaccharide synthesis family protein [Luteolibacter sp.]